MSVELNFTIENLNPNDELVARSRIRNLLDLMPEDGTHHAELQQAEAGWICKFAFVSVCAMFAATAHGSTPDMVITSVEQMIQKQLTEWHHQRFTENHYQAKEELTFSNVTVLPKVHGRNSSYRLANVLIVDDDLDSALEMQTIFKQFGCRTTVVTDIAEAESMLSLGEADFVILDWMLDANIYANQVVERSVKLINSFADLKEQFSQTKPKVVTYSGLTDFQIAFPRNCYFDHLEHWQKPLKYAELKALASHLLESSGF